LPRTERLAIAAEWWRPWRGRAEALVAGWLRAGHEVMHLSVHSFTPCLEGVERRVEIALLEDPSRAAERLARGRWSGALRERGWRVRQNHPYRGVADGHTTALRRRFGAAYAGIELELNQALLPARHEALVADLREILAGPRR
jgi:predicted N-formylglutamate amidohydrolase